MKINRIIALVLALCLVWPFCTVYAVSESPAYRELIEETPVAVTDMLFGDIPAYYATLTADEILDPSLCNYTYGDVYVNGALLPCHVYMRTFNITDAGTILPENASEAAQNLLSDIRSAVSGNYIRCIAENYSVSISAKKTADGTQFLSLTVKIFFAVNEKTEDRQSLREGYIAQKAAELMPLSHEERFLALNEMLLSGAFVYDTSAVSGGAVGFVETGRGVCEEYAALTSLMLDALGYENILITGTAQGVRHIWNGVTVQGRKYHLDILWNGPVDEQGNHTAINRTYLLVSDASCRVTHTPDSAFDEYLADAVYDFAFDAPKTVAGVIFYEGYTCLPPIDPDMTVSQLCEITQLYEFAKIYAGGTELQPDSVIPSCAELVLTVNGEELERHVLLVRGDLNKDGHATEIDLHMTVNIIIGAANIQSIFDTVLADLSGDGALTVTDVVMLYDYIHRDVPDVPPDTEDTTSEDTSPEDTSPEDTSADDTDADRTEPQQSSSPSASDQDSTAAPSPDVWEDTSSEPVYSDEESPSEDESIFEE